MCWFIGTYMERNVIWSIHADRMCHQKSTVKELQDFRKFPNIL